MKGKINILFSVIILSVFFLFCSIISRAGEITIGTGSSTTSTNPIYGSYKYSYTQQIYTAAEITAGGGSSGIMITHISFYLSSGNLSSSNSWVIYLGNTSKSSFSSTSDWETTSNMTQVYSGTLASYPGTGWLTIPLSTPFEWNGTSNLVVAVDENYLLAGTGSSWNYTSTSSNYRSMYYYNGTTNPDPASPPTASARTYSRPNIKLTYSPPPTVLWSQNFTGPSTSGIAASSGWSTNSGTTYACTGGDYVYYSSSSTNYFATNTFHVPRGKGVNINFDMKRSSGSATLELYARVGGYGSYNTSSKYYSGWMQLSTSLTYGTSCSNFTVSLPGEICGGQDLSILFRATGSYITIDNIKITDNSSKATVPDINSSALTYSFDASEYFYGPLSFDRFNPSATGNNFSYHSRYGCNNSSGAYAYISSSGGNGGQVGQSSVSGGYGYITSTTADCSNPAHSLNPCMITREFNTSNCTGSSTTLRFAFKKSYSGGHTFDEDYILYCPEIYYHQTTDGSTTGYSWTQCNVNYYFADGNWWYATTDLPKAENLIVAFAANSTDFSYFDDIKISCKDCDINDELGGAISCTSDPGLTEYQPDTEYTFTIGFTPYATHYKWIIRDLTTSEIFYGTTAGTDPAVVSGQGTQTATINLGTLGGTSYRVMCIPYDSDYGTDVSPTDACYAKISYYTTLSEDETPTPVSLISFDAKCVEGKVIISWNTSSEINNDYYRIEKSEDFKTWIEVEKLAGAGNSNQMLTYSCTDTKPTYGTIYYRLLQSDYNGTTNYFDPVAVYCEESIGSNNIIIYPNPTDDIIEINIPEAGFNIEILDILGQTVYQSENERSIDVHDFPAGTYILRIFVSNRCLVKRLIIK